MWKETTWSQTLDHEEEPVLSLSIALPVPVGERRADRRMARYYQHLGELWKARWLSVLHARAAAALDEARELSRPFQPWTAELTWRISYEDEEVASICVDAVERRTAGRPLTVRCADTWDLKTGTPKVLADVLPRDTHWRKHVVGEIRRQVGERLKGGESLFFEDAEERAAIHFSARRFYLTPEGVALFYPMWSLGSPAEGIPVFLLPREKEEPCTPGQQQK